MSSKVKTADMKKDGKTQLTPRLRFPEFQDAGGWEGSPLGDLLDYQQPTDYLVADTKYSDMYKTPVLTAGKTFILGYTNEQHGIFRDNLPVIIFDDFTTATQFVDFPFKAKSSAMKILQAKNRANIKFMYEIVQMIAYEVGAHERHWISKFAPMSILVPRPNEQQKIADCLTSVDDLIAAQVQKVDALKTHKKGLMQQLFPHEGETQPRLRFPEFGHSDGWVEKKLIDTADKSVKRSFIGGPFGSNLKSSDYVVDGIRIIQLQNIGDAEFVDNYRIFTSKEKADELLSNNIYPGDIILSKMGDPVGRACLIPDAHDRYVMCSDGIRLVVDEKINSKYFIYSLINSSKFRSSVEKTATGSTRKRIGLDELKKLPMLLPKKNEQQKIADCLSSVDELIAAQTRKVDALKTHKKGLMQQLFPSPKDVDA